MKIPGPAFDSVLVSISVGGFLPSTISSNPGNSLVDSLWAGIVTRQTELSTINNLIGNPKLMDSGDYFNGDSDCKWTGRAEKCGEAGERRKCRKVEKVEKGGNRQRANRKSRGSRKSRETRENRKSRKPRMHRKSRGKPENAEKVEKVEKPELRGLF